MNPSAVLLAGAVIGGMGLVFGAILGLIDRIFSVDEDPRTRLIQETLPGANCGGCGYAGCSAYAQEIAKGTAALNLCPVISAQGLYVLGKIMGKAISPGAKKRAAVLCGGDTGHCKIQFDYEGINTCAAASIISGGDKACHFSCLGYGDCESACAFDAIHVTDTRLAEVDIDKCTGCGACISACPRGVLKLFPAQYAVRLSCSNIGRGRSVREFCSVGCIGCGKCAQNCQYGAIAMEKNLPVIDQEKCVGCMRCADCCPTGAIVKNPAFPPAA